jgi:hypothetical protein
MTQRNPVTLYFHPSVPVQLTADAPQISSDGGALLLRQVDERLGLTSRLAVHLPDERDPARVIHSRQEQLRQRVYQIALGYEDCNDAHTLRNDPVLQAACDRLPRGDSPLSSQPTLSRMENAATPRSVCKLLGEFRQIYLDSFVEPPEVVVLDLDGTDDPTHGQQQMALFNGHYDQHMYHPLMVYDGLRGHLITAILRPGTAHDARGALGVIRQLILALKQRFPQVRILVRGDAAFAVPRFIAMLEELDAQWGGIDYLLGLAKNPALKRLGEPFMASAREQRATGQQHVRNFGAFPYAAGTWPRERHVVMKAEINPEGENPRFIVTSLEGFPPELLYDAYCERGQCENWIKDLKNALKADRLSCSDFWANFFRLLEFAAAYVLMHALRSAVAPHAPELATAQMDTLRLRLLKVGALLSQSVRRLWVRLPEAFPFASVFLALARSLEENPSLGLVPQGDTS